MLNSKRDVPVPKDFFTLLEYESVRVCPACSGSQSTHIFFEPGAGVTMEDGKHRIGHVLVVDIWGNSPEHIISCLKRPNSKQRFCALRPPQNFSRTQNKWRPARVTCMVCQQCTELLQEIKHVALRPPTDAIRAGEENGERTHPSARLPRADAHAVFLEHRRVSCACVIVVVGVGVACVPVVAVA